MDAPASAETGCKELAGGKRAEAESPLLRIKNAERFGEFHENSIMRL
jgi:hypothetical protein